MMAWYGRDYGYGDWAPYVPVATRKANAEKAANELAKKEKRAVAPVKITGRKITTTFWGKAWCENLERYSDYSNRLPRGRTYVCNGSVVDLQILRGKVRALVAGSDVYEVEIEIDTLKPQTWKQIKQDCSNTFDSLLDLLRGKFDDGVMQRLTDKKTGLFPSPAEIDMDCSCPDSAGMCKHLAAVMYGVGARLDASPELLFVLRDVDHLELIAQATTAENLDRSLKGEDSGALAETDLGELFGIEIAAVAPPVVETAPAKPGRKKARAAAKPSKSAVKTKIEKVADPQGQKMSEAARKKAKLIELMKSKLKKPAKGGKKKSTVGKKVPRTTPTAATRRKK